MTYGTGHGPCPSQPSGNLQSSTPDCDTARSAMLLVRGKKHKCEARMAQRKHCLHPHSTQLHRLPPL